LACVSLVVMRILSRAKKRVANELGCSAMHADVKQTDFRFHLSVILLLGLVLNVALGWWWGRPGFCSHLGADYCEGGREGGSGLYEG